ncbi:hypothetical protein [Rhodospirillum sp. A1_3_36]|uniref:hypothetical protein n=1 Tax=Rhodospirillum sp. A1_3_36 TaxID=3391666 RepID=UPI0039A69662
MKSLKGPSGFASRLIRHMNFEAHLIQHGLVKAVSGRPMLFIWFVAPLFGILWSVFWILYIPLVVILVSFLPISYIISARGQS